MCSWHFLLQVLNILSFSSTLWQSHSILLLQFIFYPTTSLKNLLSIYLSLNHYSNFPIFVLKLIPYFLIPLFSFKDFQFCPLSDFRTANFLRLGILKVLHCHICFIFNCFFLHPCRDRIYFFVLLILKMLSPII
jgi:hypothetical protein